MSSVLIDLTTTDNESKRARPVLVLATAQYTIIQQSKRIMQFIGPSKLRSVCLNAVRDTDVTVVKFVNVSASASTGRAVRSFIRARPYIKTIDMTNIIHLNPIVALTWIVSFVDKLEKVVLKNGLSVLIQTSSGKRFYNAIFPDPALSAHEVLLVCMAALTVNDFNHALLFGYDDNAFNGYDNDGSSINLNSEYIILISH